MYYLVRCPQCDNSDIEKREVEDLNFVGFKCCECGYLFSKSEAKFDEIDHYEIR